MATFRAILGQEILEASDQTAGVSTALRATRRERPPGLSLRFGARKLSDVSATIRREMQYICGHETRRDETVGARSSRYVEAAEKTTDTL